MILLQQRKESEELMKKRGWILISIIFLTLFLNGCSEQGGKEALQKISSTISSGDNKKGNTSFPGGMMEVHYINVGQGDSTLIKTEGHAMLIDAGENNQGKEVESYLESQGIEKLDYVIGTHPDSDHIGGLDVVLYGIECENVIMPPIESDTKTYEDVIQAAKAEDLDIISPEVNQKYSLGDADFTIVAPNEDYGNDTNNWSVGILLEYGESRFLFTGDAEEKAEEDIVSNGIDISADVYKAGHHGSKTASSEELLDAVNPEYAIISCGEDNEYGHPSAQTLNSLRMRGVKVFRTDEQGTIVAATDGMNIRFNMSPDESWTPGEPKGSAVKYVLNTNSKKYHKPDCRYVDSIQENNRENTTLSKKKLEKEGYSPCGSCNP